MFIFNLLNNTVRPIAHTWLAEHRVYFLPICNPYHYYHHPQKLLNSSQGHSRPGSYPKNTLGKIDPVHHRAPCTQIHTFGKFIQTIHLPNKRKPPEKHVQIFHTNSILSSKSNPRPWICKML